MAEKDYCDYKLVLELKELGYDYIRREGLIHLYDAQKWLREEKGIYVEVYFSGLFNKRPLFEWVIVKEYDYSVSNLVSSKEKYFSSPEALSEGIKEAVKILKGNETIHD